MTEESINSILAGLPYPPRTQEKLVTPTALQAKAYHMAKRGYIHSRKSLEALEWYMKGYALILTGPVGVGKTMFFKCVEPDNEVRILPFNSCALWDYRELRDWLLATRNSDIVIDDIGWERAVGDGLARNYGQKYDALQIVLDYRLNLSAYRTHMTTNLNNEQLGRAYDAHLIDRICELCKGISWDINEPSRRTAKPNALAVSAE